MGYTKPTTVDLDFGNVETPMSIRDGKFVSYVNFGVKDVRKLLHSMWYFYEWKTKQTKRQKEIANLCRMLKSKLDEEKTLYGYLTVPFNQ